MRILVLLCRSIIRRNKGFTAGIFIMSMLAVAIAFLGANFSQSCSDMLMQFFDQSGMPGAVCVTDILPDTLRGEMENIPGVRYVYPGFFFDTNIEIGNGKVYSVRAFYRGSDSPFRHTVHEEIRYEGADPTASISVSFAERNNVRAGESIVVDSPKGKKTVLLKAVVSNPETMYCVKDEMSSYESAQFAYLYFDNSDIEELIPIRGLSNQWLVYFEDGLDTEAQKACMGQIRKILDGHIVSETLTVESEALSAMRDHVHTISVLCSFIPGIIYLISLGFNFIFIKIIVENQRKVIGMLRALGFSIRKVNLTFALYTVLVALPALLCGSLLGGFLLRTCVNTFAESQYIFFGTVAILPGKTCLMLSIVFAIGIAAALMSSGTISKIDPCEAYGGMNNEESEPPKIVAAIRTDAFFKISIAAIIRNYKRQIVAALCITACIILMCVGFEGVLTIGYPAEAVYGGRYRYDLMVRCVDSDTVARISSEVGGVAAVEPETVFSGELLGKSVRISTIREEDEQTVLTDASGKRIFPKNGVILDEMCAKINGISIGDSVEISGYSLPVTGIAREIQYAVLYVSPQTAHEMGHEGPNCALLKLEPGAQIGDVERKIAELNGDAYFVELALVKENFISEHRTMQTVMLLFAILAFGVGSLLVLNITVIDFNENRYRYATLRALGTPVRRLGTVAIVQNLFRTALGIVIACPLCYVCTTVLLELLSGATQQYVMVKYAECVAASCLISLLYVLLGTFISLLKIKKMDYLQLYE